MILGESPYRDRPLTPEFTPEVVQDAMRGSGDPSLNFFAKTVGSFFGGRQNIECRRDFLRTVAFYNFIQDPLVRKLDRLGKCGLVRFLHSQKYSKSWNRNLFLSSHETSGIKYLPFPSISVSDGKTSTGRFYELPSRTLSFFFPINHLSSVGWSYKNWCLCVKVAIEKAINVSLTGTPRIESTWLVRGALGPLHRATAFDREQECCSVHLSGNLQDG
jgi:hypothetical protein